MKVLPANTIGIQHALEILRNGGVIAHATETCYGLACDLTNLDAVEKLFSIKKRSANQPVSALFASVTDAQRYVHWNAEALELSKKHLPGPLTLILPIRTDAPRILHPTLQKSLTLGVRVSSHPIARALVEQYKSPLSTTSANLHGEQNPYSADDIVRQFSSQELQPDLILDSGTLPPTPPSTVIDLTDSGRNIRRQGAIK